MPHTKYLNKYGQEVPSVTTILQVINKPALVNWANKMGLQGIKVGEKLNNAANVGTLAHSIIENWIKGGKPNWQNYNREQIMQACKCAKRFFEWVQKQDVFKPIVSEIELVSEQYNYGGCVDLIANVNGKRTVIDFKTCSGIWDEAKYQTSAYFNMANENGFDVTDILIIRIGWESFETFNVEYKQEAFKVFKSALILYNKIKEYKKKEEMDFSNIWS